MPSFKSAVLLLLATTQLASAYVDKYDLCPGIINFESTTSYTTVRNAAISACDAAGASCLATDTYLPSNAFIQNEFTSNFANVLNFAPTGFVAAMLKKSSETAYFAHQPALPSSCYTCYSQTNGECCKSAQASSCDYGGAALTCTSPYKTYQGTCVDPCPSTTYTNTAAGTCVACSTIDLNAATCSSTLPTSCNTNYDLIQNACVPSCLSSQYRNGSGACTACSTVDIHAATCSSTTPLTCTQGYKIGETGTVTPTSTYDATKTCPATQMQALQVITPDCVCADNFSTSCDATGSLTCVAGFAPVNNPECSGSGRPTFVCAPCGGYFSPSSTLTTMVPRPAGSELTCVICPAVSTLDPVTRTSSCTCTDPNYAYLEDFNRCFYDGVVPTNGANGKNGKDGTQGTVGNMGYNGTDGVDGKNGTNGATGLAGADGRNGTNGINGTAGARGARGPQGKPGRKGKNAPVIIVVKPSHEKPQTYVKPQRKPEYHPSSQGKSSHGKGNHGRRA